MGFKRLQAHLFFFLFFLPASGSGAILSTALTLLAPAPKPAIRKEYELKVTIMALLGEQFMVLRFGLGCGPPRVQCITTAQILAAQCHSAGTCTGSVISARCAIAYK